MFFCKQAFCVRKYVIPKGQQRRKSLKKKTPKFSNNFTAVKTVPGFESSQTEFKSFK